MVSFAMNSLTQQDVVEILKRKQGKLSLRKFARKLGVSPPFLSDVYLGRRGPGPKILDQLNLQSTRQITVTFTKKKTNGNSTV